jgi:hypothetical protein
MQLMTACYIRQYAERKWTMTLLDETQTTGYLSIALSLSQNTHTHKRMHAHYVAIYSLKMVLIQNKYMWKLMSDVMTCVFK